MDTNNRIRLSFQVETKRIIKILSNEIYDSPLSLLRENVQNAYDAILMRIVQDIDSNFEPKIELIINGKNIVIKDNGIGMNLEVLSNNFWKAGSSGKRDNSIAEKAGVIGTFGIGAMANFGVCELLEVTTSSHVKEYTYFSKAIRDELKIGEDCIETEKGPFDGRVGTEIKATLDKETTVNVQDCIAYLMPYIKYLKIPVYINGELFSQNNFSEDYDSETKNAQYTFCRENISSGGFSYDLTGFALANSIVRVKIANIQFRGESISGELALVQNSTSIMCYRNYFGLSSIPTSNLYNLGGNANLSFLTPTAGREALSRESITILKSFLTSIEQEITMQLSSSDISNSNAPFQRYISKNGLLELGKNLTIRVNPAGKEIKLGDIPSYNPEKTKSYFLGTNSESLRRFANENNDLFLPSPSNPRRRIQLHFLIKFKVRQQEDNAHVIKLYGKDELSIAEATILFKITNVFTDDYLLKEININFADISPGVTSMIKKESEVINIFLSKSAPSIIQLIHIYEVDYSVLNGFVKDYVRTELYSKISQYVPSATKQGADALHKILLKNRELFKIDAEDQGELDSLIADYLSGKVGFKEVVKKSNSISKPYKETVKVNQIGNIEDAIPSLINIGILSKLDERGEKNIELEAQPPILRLDHSTSLKLLKIEKSLEQLNNFKLFLALSERLYRRDRDFFFEPHTTKIIWGNHKVVFIFSHASNKINLYYDIELRHKIDDTKIGGTQFPTTTIITKNKIFIPLPEFLKDGFIVNPPKMSKEFYIRYDLITELD